MNMRTLTVPGLSATALLLVTSLSPTSVQAGTPTYLAAQLNGANEW